MTVCDLLVRNVHIASMVRGDLAWGYSGRKGAVAVRDDLVTWVGDDGSIPPELRPSRELDGEGRWLTPGLVDCHTHLVFAGTRVPEFERRLGGATYDEIAREGGGILSTVAATRRASEAELVRQSSERLAILASRGVTTLEVKSGYGLDVDNELKMLRVARELGHASGVTVQTTLLGAHAVPPEHHDSRGAYLDLVCEEMIPRASELGLADAVDAFCEEIAFTPEECGRVFEAAQAHGLPVRVHADQRTNSGGAALAARHRARSADHLEHASEAGVKAMAAAGTVAVLLPGAAHFLRDENVPPVATLRAHGVPIAVASDLNPGSSPLLDPLQALSLGCLLFGLTPEEALAGMTRVAARALGMDGRVGTIAVGRRADLVAWSIGHPSELSYWIGGELAWAVFRGGRQA
jgi:imidazolonepropionase